VAETRPFRGLHYASADLSSLICPPYDVISSEEQRRLYARSPFNVVRLEYGETQPDDTSSRNRYTRAATTLREWTESGVLIRDELPSFYVYDQEFTHEGRPLVRRALPARVRLHDWDDGPIRPHEHTLNQPKEDRLQLLRACRLNISPILALYRDDGAQARDAVEKAQQTAPLLATAAVNDESHRVHAVSEEAAVDSLKQILKERTFYVIDGHHRYETALAYLKERRAQAASWTGEEPENFVLMALVARDDPGLVVLPTHRLLKNVAPPDDFVALLERYFTVEPVAGVGWPALESRLADASREAVALAVATNEGQRLILRARDEREVALAMPPDSPASWRSLDAAVLQEVVLRRILGLDQQGAAADGSLAFNHDGDEALRLVESAACSLAFLLHPTPIERVLDAADTGERMPQKSTYFHPKLPAGLVMNPLY
jgi:uncharacterized protein (DUF1015 family)